MSQDNKTNNENNSETPLQIIQSKLDDIKEKISDNDYLELVTHLHKEFDRKQNNFYKIKYCVTYIDRESDNQFVSRIIFRDAIVKLPEENYRHILTKMYTCQHDLVFSDLRQLLNKEKLQLGVYSYPNNACCDTQKEMGAFCECDQVTSVDIECEPKIINIVKL
jgi:uncharacterized protein involved in type VI secretion and phage assembly